MFFILSKILSFLISPLTWIFSLLLIGLIIKDKSKKQKFIVSAFLLLTILSNSFILDEAMRIWEIPAVPTSELNEFPAGIVLGGISDYDPSLERIQFFSGNDRLMQGLLLYKKGIIKKLVFTGGSGSILHPELREGIFVSSFLDEIGIPDKDYITETYSKNTYENAIFLKPLLEKEFAKEDTFLLITSAFHMRRSQAIFQKSGINVKPFSADRKSGPRKYEFDHLFIPNLSALTGWQILLHEMTGYFVYKFKGYL